MIKYQFNTDPDGRRHFEKHGVSIEEIDEVFTEQKCFTKKRNDKSYVSYCKLRSGRYLEVLYRNISKNEYFIITAYDIENSGMIQFLDEQE